MARNAQDFDNATLEAMQHLENEDTDMFLLATGESGGEIKTMFGYNRNGDVEKGQVLNLLASLVAVTSKHTEESPHEVAVEVGREAESVSEEMQPWRGDD